ncbi:YaiI/YqxD family protein [Inconstantimicrobium porci]|uniref:YaiI/YqxD family protein n=1 Tax=Inconstantimicrobium porci TaxID=2652291 RepID=UPI0024098D44|nr:YaiI/YqxD family protein [Inconstantimicrobium porci]MDD6770753.1 YaiI/YqxD family protein [Inconstantimicrobium porci]
MKILVDGDACPGRQLIEKAAKEDSIPVIILCDINHYITSDYSEVICVDAGFQSVDVSLINKASKGDIVVTGDFGVVAMALGKGAYAISGKGFVYDDSNIDKLLFERHIAAKARRAGNRTSTIKKRTTEDDDRLYKNLKFLISKARK